MLDGQGTFLGAVRRLTDGPAPARHSWCSQKTPNPFPGDFVRSMTKRHRRVFVKADRHQGKPGAKGTIWVEKLPYEERGLVAGVCPREAVCASREGALVGWPSKQRPVRASRLLDARHAGPAGGLLRRALLGARPTSTRVIEGEPSPMTRLSEGDDRDRFTHNSRAGRPPPPPPPPPPTRPTQLRVIYWAKTEHPGYIVGHGPTRRCSDSPRTRVRRTNRPPAVFGCEPTLTA